MCRIFPRLRRFSCFFFSYHPPFYVLKFTFIFYYQPSYRAFFARFPRAKRILIFLFRSFRAILSFFFAHFVACIKKMCLDNKLITRFELYYAFDAVVQISSKWLRRRTNAFNVFPLAQMVSRKLAY